MERIKRILHDLLYNPDYEWHIAIVLMCLIFGVCVSIAIYGFLFY